MIKKTVLALFSLVFAMALVAPPKANAAVVVGIGVGPGPGYVAPYVYPGRVVVGYRPYGYRHDWHGYGWRR